MNNGTYVIGEIGQNHNGSVDIAKLIIEIASRLPKDELFNTSLPPMNAVKLTKRHLDYELTNSAMQKAYNNKNSFGETYGKHRAFLELTDEEHFECYKHAKLFGLDFVETLCAKECLSLLKLFIPDKLKVASRDLTNLPLLEALAETKIPMIISTGMADKRDLDEALNVITQYHNNVAILHCVSEYPTKYSNINLETITYLKKNYSQFEIGYSDHSIGIMIPVAAVAKGATIIEKHITIDRQLKGTDQEGSLGPDGIRRMMRDIRILDLSMGEEVLYRVPDVEGAKNKLERSIATNKILKVGHIITEADIHLLSPGNGFKWRDKDIVIGKIVVKRIEKNELIFEEFLKNEN